MNIQDTFNMGLIALSIIAAALIIRSGERRQAQSEMPAPDLKSWPVANTHLQPRINGKFCSADQLRAYDAKHAQLRQEVGKQ